MYTFTGRIKKIGITEETNFCEFDVDNTIKINEKDEGIAFDGTNLIIVNEFEDIKDKIFIFLLTMINERLEVEFSIDSSEEDNSTSKDAGIEESKSENTEDGKSKSEQGEKKIEITKVTVLR